MVYLHIKAGILHFGLHSVKYELTFTVCKGQRKLWIAEQSVTFDMINTQSTTPK